MNVLPTEKQIKSGHVPSSRVGAHLANGKGMRRSVLTVQKSASRKRREYGSDFDPTGLTRDELRALAKEQGVAGWHKMNKKALIAAIEWSKR